MSNVLSPWGHYDTAVYWNLPYDGAPHKCNECNELKPHTEVYLTQIPKDDSRSVICKDCIDDVWLARAKFMGVAN